MMRKMKAKLPTILIMLSVFFVGLLCWGTKVNAATSGSFDDEGSVTWTLDANGTLWLHGIRQGSSFYAYVDIDDWDEYWTNAGLDKSQVKAVRFTESSAPISFRFYLIGMFKDFVNCEEIYLSRGVFGETWRMDSMFEGCTSLKILQWNPSTVSVTHMGDMFKNCSSLVSMDLTEMLPNVWNTSKVEDMRNMFQGCTSLQSVNFGTLETDSLVLISDIFRDCTSLTSVTWNVGDTSNLYGMNQMFAGCTSLTTVDMTGFETQNVKQMYGMFENCTALQNVDLSKLNTSQVYWMDMMFYNCNSLQSIDVSNFDTSSVPLYNHDINFMFKYCNSLKKLDVSNFVGGCPSSLICNSLEEFTSANGTYNYYIESDGDYWYDTSGNIYVDGTVFQNIAPKTTLYRAKPSYNINYVYQGTLVNCPTTYVVDEGVATLGTVELEHYTFGGWYANEMSNTPVTSIPAGTLFDQTLYARMIPDTYNITYHNTELATNVETLFTTYQYSRVRALPELTSDCYVFDGWYLDEGLTQKLDSITATTGGDLILYAKWTLAHEHVLKDAKEATCTTTGYTGDWYCNDCQKVVERGTEVTMLDHDIDKTKGTIITPATAITEGTIQYQCKNCTYTVTETISKVGADFTKEQGIPEETVAVTDKTILTTKNDNDIAGSSFAAIQARADKTTKKSIRLKWNKVKNADGYKIYGNKCGKKNRYEYIKTISNGNTTKYTQKKLKKGTYYKYIVRAYKLIDGQEVTIAVSKTIHASTTGGKFGNAKSVKIKTDKKMKSKKGVYTLTIKKNKKYTIKASEVKQSKKIKKHRAIKFESSDASIATVSSKGVVKGVKKGTCYIYAYAQNGAYKKIKVKVK